MPVNKKKKVSKKKKVAKKDMKPVVQDGDFSKAHDGHSGDRVFVSMSKTINIGNYESIRVEYGMGVGNFETGDGGFDRARKWCQQEVTSAMKEMIGLVEDGSLI